MTQSHKREEQNGILKWEMTSNRRSIEVALKVAIKRGRDTDSYVSYDSYAIQNCSRRWQDFISLA